MSALLVLLTLFAMVVGVASGKEGSDTSSGNASAEAESTPVRELPSLRTATSRTFLLSDGQHETRIFEVPVNYRDKDAWKPIDEELTELPGGAVSNGANSFDLHLPEDLDQAPVRVDLADGQWISQRPLAPATQPVEVAGEVATYAPESLGVGFEFIGLADGFKENIVLAGPSAPSTYHYALDASPGISPELTDDGTIEFRDAEGGLVGMMPAPVMADSATEPQVSDAIRYAIDSDGAGSWRLAVEADPEWLADPARKWPVKIDPTVTVNKPALDCIIVNDGSTTPRCAPGQTYLLAKAQYVSSGTDRIARSLLRFNLGAIPASAPITSATIGLYSAKTATNITKVDLYDVSIPWTSSVTWAKRDSSQNWWSPGGNYGAKLPNPASLTPAERGGSGPGWWNFSSPELAWLVERWRYGTFANNGVFVKLADETPHVCCFERRVEWHSSSATNKPSVRPARSGGIRRQQGHLPGRRHQDRQALPSDLGLGPQRRRRSHLPVQAGRRRG